jgi:hypothetical protein
MRLAVFAVGLVLLPGVRAHADVLMNVDLPSATLPVAQDDVVTDDLTAPAANVLLPEETGAATLVLSQQATTAVTPEPQSLVLLASGLVAVGGLIWRRRLVSRAVTEATA